MHLICNIMGNNKERPCSLNAGHLFMELCFLFLFIDVHTQKEVTIIVPSSSTVVKSRELKEPLYICISPFCPIQIFNTSMKD